MKNSLRCMPLNVYKQDTDKVSGVFINFSNHPSINWSDEQLDAVHALTKGAIVDVPFPQVCASADEIDISLLALECLTKIYSLHPTVVMCQGEFGLAFAVVRALKEMGIRVVYSCSERRTSEKVTGIGSVKTSEFVFVRFRDY